MENQTKRLMAPIHRKDIAKLTVKTSKDVLHIDLALEELLKDTWAPAVSKSRICQGYEGQEINREGLIYGCEYGCAKRRKQTVEGNVPQHDLDATYVIDQVGTLRSGSEDPLGLEGITEMEVVPHSHPS